MSFPIAPQHSFNPRITIAMLFIIYAMYSLRAWFSSPRSFFPLCLCPRFQSGFPGQKHYTVRSNFQNHFTMMIQKAVPMSSCKDIWCLTHGLDFCGYSLIDYFQEAVWLWNFNLFSSSFPTFMAKRQTTWKHNLLCNSTEKPLDHTSLGLVSLSQG